MRYLVITPVKDEERYIEHTLRSMAAQTVKPESWIIVDDGSTDRTLELVRNYVPKCSFLRVITRPSGQPRQPGSAVVRAFNRGYEAAHGVDYDFIVKLDGDLSFEPDYFEELLKKFVSDPSLGIASGVCLETVDGTTWNEIPMPYYHAWGASKVIRRACWKQIGGFVPSRGWDTVDEIRAITHGWRTTHFPDLRMQHWKAEGTGIGQLKTNAMHGEVYYLTGGGLMFLLLKVLHRLKCRPFLIGGAALFWGYIRSVVAGEPRLVNDDEARRYRQLLNRRILDKLKIAAVH